MARLTANRVANTRNNSLVYNGGFETVPSFTATQTTDEAWLDGTASGSTALKGYGWAVPTLALTTGATAQFDSSVKRSGNASVKLSQTDTASNVVVATHKTANSANAFALIPLLPNTEYTLSGYAQTASVPTNGAYMQIRQYSASIGTVSTTSTNKLSGTNGWTLLTLTFTTAATTRFGSILLRIADDVGNICTGWFDDITLTPTAAGRTATSRSYSLVYNGNFEIAPTFVAATNTSARWVDGSASGSAAQKSQHGWAIVSGTTAGTFSAQYDATAPNSGTNSMKLSLGATGSALEVGPVTSITTLNDLRCAIPVSGSTAYTCTYWMRTNLTSGSSTSGAYLRANERNNIAGGSVNNDGTKILTTTGWTQYTINFTTASATRFIIIRASLVGTGGSANLVMDAWFDDIVLTPTAGITRLTS